MARPVDRPDIATTDDIARLVRRFYAVALVDDLLGPIFAAAGLDLDVHLPRIAAFWERQLLALPNYQGNMVRVHLETHDRTPLDGAAFERWLALWDDGGDARQGSGARRRPDAAGLHRPPVAPVRRVMR
jgi:hemoglobin